MPIDPFSGVNEIAAAIRARRVSCAEVTAMYLQRIAKHNKALNAVCTLDEEGAKARAKDADAALARGELKGPLHGVPMTIKDALETAGLRTTGGYPPLANHIPKKDATAAAPPPPAAAAPT